MREVAPFAGSAATANVHDAFRRGALMVKKALSFLIAAAVFLGPPLAQAQEDRAGMVVRSPSVTSRNDFRVDAPLKTWTGMLDNLYLMGKLWEIYNFQPPYKTSRVDSGFHLADPTGISADVRLIDQSDRSRTFYAEGRFDHWAIPAFFSADAVFVFEYEPDGDEALKGVLKIYMRGSNGVSRFVMNAFSDVLVGRINNRFRSNLEDAKKIIHDIINNPETLRKGLTGAYLNEFNRLNE
jgi:hypothetical protein